LKPNYQFEKRQRELEKKKKKAEKALKRESSPEAASPAEGETPSDQGEGTLKPE
jgi:hypothetical protein